MIIIQEHLEVCGNTSETNQRSGTNTVEIMVPLKCLSNFWRTIEMPLINCEINLILTWSQNRLTSNA